MLNASSKLPSSVYVFVVMSLAAFLMMFTVVHRPRTQFVAQVRVPVPSPSARDLAEVKQTLLSPLSVVDALRRAEMIRGEASKGMLVIAAEISSRMRVEAEAAKEGQPHVLLSLRTEHPDVGVKLLDQMRADYVENASVPSGTAAAPALAKRIYGSSIAPESLLLIIMCSALVGLGGLVWLENTNAVPVLLTQEDVVNVSHLPVVVDFSSNQPLPERARRQARRRRFRVALGGAELAIAAAVLLMLFNIATVQAFSDLVTRDPLSAYSEALGRLLG